MVISKSVSGKLESVRGVGDYDIAMEHGKTVSIEHGAY